MLHLNTPVYGLYFNLASSCCMKDCLVGIVLLYVSNTTFACLCVYIVCVCVWQCRCVSGSVCVCLAMSVCVWQCLCVSGSVCNMDERLLTSK